MIPRCLILGTSLCLVILSATTVLGADLDESRVEYNRDVRPILAENCFRCHGPDTAAREADLRLDTRETAIADRGGTHVIAPGRPAASDLIRRVTSATPDQQMPPPDSGSALTPADIQILRRWIQEGATYQTHWAFVPPQRSLPAFSVDDGWCRNAIDRFVRARHDRLGLTPSAEATSATLLRRVTLDLTGLPPTLAEVAAFETAVVSNPTTAYDQLVDRLLASPRYGERMATAWLDAARYADTNGYFTDNDRTMWPWRDWVITAFNENMPFDQFTIEQLAGDLLNAEESARQAETSGGVKPDGASSDHSQRSMNRLIATGFNRNHMVNNETGIIEEEFRVEYVVDRLDTTATVWMGLTLGCARCHDHKYDPVSQRDFYRFFAFFNNVPERGLSGSSGNAPPLVKVPSIEHQADLERLRTEVEESERQFAAIEEQLAADQAAWERNATDGLPAPTKRGLVAHFPLDDAPPTFADSPVASAGPDIPGNPGLEVDRPLLGKTGNVKLVDGLLGKAASLVGEGCLHAGQAIDFERTDAFSWGAWVRPQRAGCIISKTDDAHAMRGFDVTLRNGKAIINLVSQWNRNAIQVATVSSIPSGQWQHLMVTYDGTSRAVGVRVYLDGRSVPVAITHDHLTGSIRNQQPLRIGRRQASASFSGQIDDVRLYDRELTAFEVAELASSQLVRGVIARPPESRDPDQRKKLRTWFLENHADRRFAVASNTLDQLRDRQRTLLKNVPTTMVMRDSESPRPTFMLTRGQYDQPGEPVTASFPEFLDRNQSGPRSDTERSLPSEPPLSRLDLARWLVAPSHPLTARVTVNRLWYQLFGTGIVKTVDDFGTQGEWPSHPELLDWMAVELVESGWDIKHLLRLIVTSATYRQSSIGRPALYQSDPENRLLARGPRFRLDAETLRDSALLISGLLAENLGGPSVNPYQPAGLWEDVTYDGDSSYGQSVGPALYRRSLYTFWKRQSPPPNMLVFDATTRETCTVQRSRTNTPLQALVLMNDPTFVEAARVLAERVMVASTGDRDRLAWAFRAATARAPTPEESRILLQLFHQQRTTFARRPNEGLDLLQVGASAANASLDPVELAAWTTVTSIILSLDETITKP